MAATDCCWSESDDWQQQLAGGRAAWTQSLAALGTLGRDSVCGGTANPHDVVARRRGQCRLAESRITSSRPSDARANRSRRRRLCQDPVFKPALTTGATVVGRLRKDAALHDVPPTLKPGKRPGRRCSCKYGPNRINLANRGAPKRGWQNVECSLYGKRVVTAFESLK